MALYILRRLLWSALTILGVMVVTFLLFRVVAGDIAAVWKGAKATEAEKAEWRHRFGYDRPPMLNVHRHLRIVDRTAGDRPFSAKDSGPSDAVNALALILPAKGEVQPARPDRTPEAPDQPTEPMLIGRWVFGLGRDTAIGKLTRSRPLVLRRRPPPEADTRPAETQPAASAPTQPAPRPPELVFSLSDGSRLAVSVADVRTAGDLLDRINRAPDNGGRLEASISTWSWRQLGDSQFFHHLWGSVSFQSRSLKDNRPLTRIIAEHAPYSLAITVPAMATGWVLAMVLSSLVAYYRGKTPDRLGVLVAVLGMCIPYLAFMMYGQRLMFWIAPRHAYGIFFRANVYVPIAIMVVAGLGGSVRFYRTIILDETNRDYVRTARAKGVPLPGILFKHVLRNCMLPILTNLILAIPFLILGSLLMESYFGIPGLGDLMLTSINERNEPILNGLVFLTALVYTIGVLITDLSYAVFDPRIRLR